MSDDIKSGVAVITGARQIGAPLTATLPPNEAGTLQFTQISSAGAKTPISGAVAAGVNSLVYVPQPGDLPFGIGCDASNIVKSSAPVQLYAAAVASATKPGAPTGLVLTAGAAAVSAAFSAPASTGSSPITSYRVTLSNGNIATGATSPISVPSVAGAAVTATVAALNTAGWGAESAVSNSATPSAGGASFGPFVQGAPVTRTGSFLVTAGDDFNTALDIITPAKPLGKWRTTNSYAAGGGNGRGPRGTNVASPGLLTYDVDPFHTGYLDLNRGVAVPAYNDSIVQSNSQVSLKVRAASAGEIALSCAPAGTLPLNGATLDSWTCLSFTAPFCISASITLSKSQTNMRGWHDTMWSTQIDSTAAHGYTGYELDWESNSSQTFANRYQWVGTPTSNPALDGSPITLEGTKHLKEIEVWQNPSDSSWNVTHWLDGQIHKTAVLAGYDPTKPHTLFMTAHAVPASGTDTYTAADWTAAGAAGAVTTYDYFAISTATGVSYTPQVAPLTFNIDFNAGITNTFQLPTTAALWGSNIAEELIIAPIESIEPQGSYFGGYRGLPAGTTYDTSTNIITMTPTTLTRPGRLAFYRHAMVQGGTACVPHVTIVNVGPNITVTTLAAATKNVAYTFDLYAVCDCGALVSDVNGNKAKTITVTGLPSGLAYSDTTGLVTGTTAVDFNKSISVTVTNNIGQAYTKLIGFSTTSAATANETAVLPVIQGSPVFRNAYVPNDASLVTLGAATPPQINALAPIAGGTVTLANSSTTTSPTRELLTMPNGNQVYAAHFTGSASQFMSANGLTLTPGGSLVMVYAASVAAVNNTIFERTLNASNTTTNREQIMTLAAGVSARRCDSTGSGFIDAETLPARNTTGVHVAMGVFPTGDVTGGGKVVSMNFDGVATAVTATVAGNITSLDTVNMGARIGAGTTNLPFNGYLIAAYDLSTELTAAQREEFMVFLNAKYGIVNLA